MSLRQLRRILPAERRQTDFRAGVAIAVLGVLAGCAAPPVQRVPEVEDTACRAAAAGDVLVGSWLSVRRQPGVSGELKTFIQLRPDGTMSYAEQLTRPKRAPQGLAEKGCWHREGGSTLVLRTLESNGSPVDHDDPIYVNHYELRSDAGERLQLGAPDGARLDARRMPPDYRLMW